MFEAARSRFAARVFAPRVETVARPYLGAVVPMSSMILNVAIEKISK
jgi:hypothetical protein